jgi:hypothetical protein
MGWTGCFPLRVSLQRLLPAIDRRSGSWIPATPALASIGIDNGKDVFHLVGFDANGKIALRKDQASGTSSVKVGPNCILVASDLPATRAVSTALLGCPLWLRHATRLRILSEVLIKLSRLHTCDDGVKRRDELVLVRYHDRRLSLLELDCLRPVAHRQPDC